MDLQPNDLHLMLDRMTRTAKLFDATGALLYECPVRNRTVNDAAPPDQQYAPCPAGEFVLADPVRKGTPPFGPFFIAMLDAPPSHAMADNGRAGIGLHGGGSGLAFPFAPRQPFVATLGCWRFWNESLIWLVGRLAVMKANGGRCCATVMPWTRGLPGAAGGEDDTIIPPDGVLAEGE